MTGFSDSPKLSKGALIAFDPALPIPTVLPFQYNPESVTRRLEPRTVGDGGDRSEAMRLSGPPKETITLKLEIDATDALESSDGVATKMGIHPTLAALELILYPKSPLVLANAALAQIGNLEIVPPEAPLTVLVWGPLRVVPVRISSFSVTEDAHDPMLNPIRASVDLTLTVLSYFDLQIDQPGYAMFMAHQIGKEVLSLSNLATGAPSVPRVVF